MTILLPTPRLPQTAVPRFHDWGADQEPPMGGPAQRLNRMGSRYSLEISYPRLKPEPDGRVLMSRIRRAKTQGARFPFPQPGFDVGSPGSPVVDGSGSLGTTLPVRGFTAGYAPKEGQFFSIIVAGRRYLHEVAADTVANGSGVASLSIWPMLRVSPGDGAVCEFAQPYIEGFLPGAEATVELAIARATPATIVIKEAE